jgi:hypothetical protein
VGEKCPAPCGFRIAHTPTNNRRWKPPHWPTTSVDDPSLPSQRLATLDDSNEIAVSFAQAIVLHDRKFTLVPIDLEDIGPQTSSDCARIEFYLKNDSTGNNVECAAETKKGRHFRFAAAGTLYRKATQLVFDDGGHRHAVILSCAPAEMCSASCMAMESSSGSWSEVSPRSVTSAK